jgi:membrane protease YdiL (CAAX protease family)
MAGNPVSTVEQPRPGRGLAIAVTRGVLFFTGTVLASRTILGEGVDPYSGSQAALVVVAVLLTIDAVGTSLALWKVGGQTPRSLGWRFDDVLRDVAVGVAGFVVCAAIIATVIVVFLGHEGLVETLTTIRDFSLAQRLCFFAIGVFGASIAEESLYRGYLQPALVQRLGPVGGIVVTSLVFSVMHFNFKPISLIAKALLGATYGVVAMRTSGLLAPAVTHALVWWVIGAS